MPSFFPNHHPQLPSFKSILVKGPYHPSAPLHFALSQSNQSKDATALLFSSSSRNLNLSLRQYNDEWFTSKSGHGDISAIASRIQIFYPPTPAHLIFLLTTLHVVGSDVKDIDIAHPKTVLATTPSVIILHELSSYFLKEDEPTPNSENWTVASYLTLVARAASFITFLSSQSSSLPIALTLFDSRLDELKLPVYKQPVSINILFPRPVQKVEPEEVTGLVQHYFEWVATFREANATAEMRSMELKLCKYGFCEVTEEHRWTERRSPHRSAEFIWKR